MKITCSILVLLLCLNGIAGAHNLQDTLTAEQRYQQAIKKTKHNFGKNTNHDTTLEVIERLARYDTLLKGEMYDYYKFGLAHRKKAFEWNLLSSKITFWCVIVLVFTGILFAGIQFYIALRGKRPAVKSTESGKAGESGTVAAYVPAPIADLKTELEAGADGIKVSSPVLGVIILVISLLFFYLYLAYVYPIQENF